ncbi:lactadherin-like [Chironomus tepperi]|uniref:lactadherin-like n=1 Tax=Chironomus tepperi TaxID=113505 RepID=UPI00391F4A1D
MTKAIYCILIFLLFSKVLKTDSCTSFNKKIPPRFNKDGDKLPCVGDYSSEWCMNGGTCYVLKHQDKLHYHCTCLEHFSGERCIKDNRETEVEVTRNKEPCNEPYKTNFCLNNGTCYILKYSGHPEYHCECPTGFNGYKCEEKTLDGFYGNGLSIK